MRMFFSPATGSLAPLLKLYQRLQALMSRVKTYTLFCSFRYSTMSIPFLILRVASNGGITWNGEAIAGMSSKMPVKFRCCRLRGSGGEDFLFLDERLQRKWQRKLVRTGLDRRQWVAASDRTMLWRLTQSISRIQDFEKIGIQPNMLLSPRRR